MSLSPIALVAVAVALALSPDSLAALGNQVGAAGAGFFYAVALAVAVHCLTAMSYGRLYGPGGEARLLKSALGPSWAVALPISSRLLFAVCGATALLATAGYVVNEVFLSWFPNLGFSFLLLACLAVINLAGERTWSLFQILFVGIALAGLGVLTFAGLISSAEVLSERSAGVFPSPEVIFRGFLLFLGFDLAAFLARENGEPSRIVKPMVIGILASGLVLFLWGLVSMAHVAPEMLAESTIPHTLVARAILGEAGRWWMGAVVLAGVCAAVNALFRGVSRMLAGMAAERLLPSFLGGQRAGIPAFLIALATATMLGLGMAGEPVLDAYLAGGVWLWLLNYAGIHLSFLIMGGRGAGQSRRFRPAGYPWLSVIAVVALSIVLVGLLWYASDISAQIRFMALALGGGFVFGVVFSRIAR